MSNLENVLNENFKFVSFKSQLQEDAIREIAKREDDVLVSMPTGSGKSLCYQLPALLFSDKVTLVFSPLLALIKDQIDHLSALNIKAASLNSKTLTAERNFILSDLKSNSPSIRLLYITPEQAMTQTFKAQNAIKAFTKMVEFCETANECRHMLFSNHFGEPPPDCRNRCDICRNKKEVQERANNFLMRCIQFSETSTSMDVEFNSDLYEGGREGINEETQRRLEEDSNNQHERDEKIGKQSTALIRKQFALRKNPQEMSQDTINKLFSKRSQVLAAASTSNKVNGLTIVTREQYLSKIIEVLTDNYKQCCEDQTFTEKDLKDCAADLEYSCFSSTTTLTMYRSVNAKLVMNIKNHTKDKQLDPSLDTFTPKSPKNETLTDLFRNMEKEKKKSEASDDFKPVPTDRRKGEKKQASISSYFKIESDEEKKNMEKIKSLFGDDADDEPSPVDAKGDFASFKIKKDVDDDRVSFETTSTTKEYKSPEESYKRKPDETLSREVKKSKVDVPKMKKSEIGLLVVKLLTPAYAERRFDSRDTFKTTARSISHALLYKDETEIKRFVKNFLKNHEKITASTTITF
ncbi:hypothetical protein FQR65_LT16475 [Abscondita terminalis]|nr:hypothetical protein FQR65_LT16475 [Abscondita terminalis]